MSKIISKKFVSELLTSTDFKKWLLKRRWFSNKSELSNIDFDLLMTELQILNENFVLIVFKISRREYQKNYFVPLVFCVDLKDVLEQNEMNENLLKELEKEAYNGKIKVIEAEYFRRFWRYLFSISYENEDVDKLIELKLFDNEKNGSFSLLKERIINLIEARMNLRKPIFNLKQLGKGNTTNLVFLLSFIQQNNDKIMDKKIVLKSYKHYQKNIETEKLNILRIHNFKNVPELIGVFRSPSSDVINIMEYIESDGNIGQVLWDELNQLVKDVFSIHNNVLISRTNINQPKDLLEDYCSLSMQLLTLLGSCVKELHENLVLESDNNFCSENITPIDFISDFSSKLDFNLSITKKRLKDFLKTNPEMASSIDMYLEKIPHSTSKLYNKVSNMKKIKLQPIHQDLHMEQTIYRRIGENYSIYFLDFEGDPQLTYQEKIKKQIAEKDFASLLRSLSYIKYNSLAGFVQYTTNKLKKLYIRENILFSHFFLQEHEISISEEVITLLNFWETSLKTIVYKSVNVSPVLLDLASLERILSELNYELLYRPKNVLVPLLGLKEWISINS
ncbi:MAG: hypothetical protein JW891_07810 [Candidatus Lokiarchaeota archaeon]|nr:hypothetical protein [Candidatus Lokiarchaeota archaeon]